GNWMKITPSAGKSAGSGRSTFHFTSSARSARFFGSSTFAVKLPALPSIVTLIFAMHPSMRGRRLRQVDEAPVAPQRCEIFFFPDCAHTVSAFDCRRNVLQRRVGAPDQSVDHR